MNRAKGRAVLAHSGGPTAVINATLLGVVEQVQACALAGALHGARFGIQGILANDFIDLSNQSEVTLRAVARTPSSALGTSRREIVPADIDHVLGVFRSLDVRYFFYNGGNGSMGTAFQLHSAARQIGYDLHVIGIPKTIDNDLFETDHTPGYASAARFFASAVRDIGADNRALPGQVEFIEVLGRNVGWLVAATSLARKQPDDAPHLIYFPEERLPLEKLLADIDSVYSRLNRCVVAVCEGQLDEKGEPFGADVRSGSRGSLAMNLAHRLAVLVGQRLKLRARSEKPGLLGRSNSAFVAYNDWNEAYLAGKAAVEAALHGEFGKMVTLLRESARPYRMQTGLTDLERVAFRERPFPPEWRMPGAAGVSDAFVEYVAPLIGELDYYPALEPIRGSITAAGSTRVPK